MKDKKDKRRPEEQYKEEDEDKTDPGSSDSDSEDEECRITFPTKKDLEKRYFLPPSFSVPDGKTETETETRLKSMKRGRTHCQMRKNQSGERKGRMTFG